MVERAVLGSHGEGSGRSPFASDDVAGGRPRGEWAPISEGIGAFSFVVGPSRELCSWELAQGDLFDGMPAQLSMLLRRQAS